MSLTTFLANNTARLKDKHSNLFCRNVKKNKVWHHRHLGDVDHQGLHVLDVDGPELVALPVEQVEGLVGAKLDLQQKFWKENKLERFYFILY